MAREHLGANSQALRDYNDKPAVTPPAAIMRCQQRVGAAASETICHGCSHHRPPLRGAAKRHSFTRRWECVTALMCSYPPSVFSISNTSAPLCQCARCMRIHFTTQDILRITTAQWHCTSVMQAMTYCGLAEAWKHYQNNSELIRWLGSI